MYHDRMMVMIVDDNPRMRAMIRAILEADDLATCECADGAEAVAHYAAFRPDWVLMDIEMEPMDGFEASAAIISRDPGANIVIVTQHDHPAFREKARSIGTKQYVLKERLRDLVPILRPDRRDTPRQLW